MYLNLFHNQKYYKTFIFMRIELVILTDHTRCRFDMFPVRIIVKQKSYIFTVLLISQFDRN